ncbi:hypothetical protein Peur_028637 [Populus x canadensis]
MGCCKDIRQAWPDSDLVFPIDVARRAMQIEETDVHLILQSLKANRSLVQPVMMVSSKSGAGLRGLRTVLSKVARFGKLQSIVRYALLSLVKHASYFQNLEFGMIWPINNVTYMGMDVQFAYLHTDVNSLSISARRTRLLELKICSRNCFFISQLGLLKLPSLLVEEEVPKKSRIYDKEKLNCMVVEGPMVLL